MTLTFDPSALKYTKVFSLIMIAKFTIYLHDAGAYGLISILSPQGFPTQPTRFSN
jgi:hypothetical protein